MTLHNSGELPPIEKILNVEVLSNLLGVYVYEIDSSMGDRFYYKYTTIYGSEDYTVDSMSISDFKSFFRKIHL